MIVPMGTLLSTRTPGVISSDLPLAFKSNMISTCVSVTQKWKLNQTKLIIHDVQLLSLVLQ